LADTVVQDKPGIGTIMTKFFALAGVASLALAA
jgi:hypothetical protein